MTATAPPLTDSAPNDWKPELHDVPLDAIDLVDNVRADVGDVDELAASIRSVGVLEPIRVVDAGAGRYQLLFGQRRLAAARAVDLGTIPAIVLASAAPVDRTVAQLIENLHRADLNALDTARAYRAILDEGITQRELGNLIGVAQPTIANTLRLLKAPEAIQQRVAAGELTRSHVEAIARLPKGEQEEVARRAVEHGLSTRGLEGEIELADQRKREADRQRDELAKIIPAAAAKVPKLLKERGLTKANAKLIVENDELAHALMTDGFTVVTKPKKEPVQLYAEADAKADACGMLSVRWYASWGSNYPPQLTAVCIDPEHEKARIAAATKRREVDDRRWKRENEKRAEAAAEERKAQRGTLAGTAAIVAGNPARMERLDLWGLTSGRSGVVGEWLAEHLTGKTTATPEDLWAKIETLDERQVTEWRARVLAEWLLNAFPVDDPMRVVFTIHAEEPKPKRRTKATA